ncbi:hypothetical protein WA026_005629 [Henosepilachna vigintioctopunctata]|uniref:Serpin domain-containing protein n=1 Tax=Henosepilachna vigintioctopunctata TaxID=420089 RepID=A0AAW1U2P9_9CUCU
MMKIFFLIFVFLCDHLQDGSALLSIPDSNNALDLQVYEEAIKGHNNNVVYSPYSLQTILAEMAVGARGDTANQIKKALKLNFEDQVIRDAFRDLTKNLSNINHIKVNSASRAYLADGLEIEPNFIKIAEEDFNSGIENIDFNKGKEAARKINSWVEKETHGKIKELMGEDQLNTFTRFVLVNTLYFRGQWFHSFDEDDTEKKDFHKSLTEKIQVDMMKMSGNFELMKLPGLEVTLLKLPFANRKAELIILLPDKIDGLPEAEKNSEQIWMHYNYTRTYVKVYLPKFRIESNIDMVPILKNMGITNLFAKADLSGITKEDVHVSAVRQKTFIDVNESGVEAASATSAVGEGRSLHFSKQVAEIFKADHPFIFCILYDNNALITGRLTNL